MAKRDNHQMTNGEAMTLAACITGDEPENIMAFVLYVVVKECENKSEPHTHASTCRLRTMRECLKVTEAGINCLELPF